MKIIQNTKPTKCRNRKYQGEISSDIYAEFSPRKEDSTERYKQDAKGKSSDLSAATITSISDDQDGS